MMKVRSGDRGVSQDTKGFALVTGASSGIDAFGNAHEIGDGTVPPGLEVKVRLAAAYCPEVAISIIEKQGD
jgi:ferredoxin